jgi:tetratricopeptide (TPR) repeat protein
MLLNQARGEKLSASEARSLATTAITEADLAIDMNPNDAATLIVKSLALKQLKKPAAALKVLNKALSNECSGSLSKEERADTLLQRAELTLEQMKGSRDNRIQGVFKDLQESISLQPSNPQAHFMVGTCCEKTGDIQDATVAYQQALVVMPTFTSAQAALDRLSKSSQDPVLAVSV